MKTQILCLLVLILLIGKERASAQNTYLQNIDLFGFDIGYQYLSSLDACQNYCNQQISNSVNFTCHAWTAVASNSGYLCYTKYAVTSIRSSSGSKKKIYISNFKNLFFFTFFIILKGYSGFRSNAFLQTCSPSSYSATTASTTTTTTTQLTNCFSQPGVNYPSNDLSVITAVSDLACCNACGTIQNIFFVLYS
jgi:hypothetical protein